MALSIDWNTKIITIPQSDLTFESGSEYSYDVGTTLKAALKALEASEEGIVNDDIHRHSTEKVLSGITYARMIEIINDYTITFEDGQYSVFLYGANHNVLDVVNKNQVSLITNLSAGMTVPSSGKIA